MCLEAFEDWIVVNNRCLSNSSRVAHMLEESVSFLLKGTEEAVDSLLSAGRVAQQHRVTGAGVHGFAVSILLEKFGHTRAVRLQLLRRFSLCVQLTCFL